MGSLLYPTVYLECVHAIHKQLKFLVIEKRQFVFSGFLFLVKVSNLNLRGFHGFKGNLKSGSDTKQLLEKIKVEVRFFGGFVLLVPLIDGSGKGKALIVGKRSFVLHIDGKYIKPA